MNCIYDNNYLVYNDGRVYSKYNNRFLKKRMDKRGYPVVDMGKKKGILVHRLVTIHYIDNPHNLKFVDHINRIRDDNNVSNLRWASRLDNNNNKSQNKNNTSGHKNIYFVKSDKLWEYKKTYYGNLILKANKSKIDILCYKYIILLRIKAGHYN